METTYWHDLPGDTEVCIDPRHENPCTIPCPGCAVDCDPRLRTTLTAHRRALEIDAWLAWEGATVIRVRDLEAALRVYDPHTVHAERGIRLSGAEAHARRQVACQTLRR